MRHGHDQPFPPHIQAQIDQDRTQGGHLVDVLIGFHRDHTDDGVTSDRATVCLLGKLLAEIGSPSLEFALAVAIERLAKDRR